MVTEERDKCFVRSDLISHRNSPDVTGFEKFELHCVWPCLSLLSPNIFSSHMGTKENPTRS